MAIIIDREKRIVTLQTKHTSYQMKADEMGVLLQCARRCTFLTGESPESTR